MGSDINVYDVYAPACKKLSDKYGVNILEEEPAVIRESDAVILAVKPNVIGSVLAKINIALDDSDTLLISIACALSVSGALLSSLLSTLSISSVSFRSWYMRSMDGLRKEIPFRQN